MSAEPASMLSFSIRPDTQVARLLLVHDAYIRARSRRRIIEHVLVILGGAAMLFWFIPNPALPSLHVAISVGWTVMLVTLGGSIVRELVLRNRREQLLNVASSPVKEAG